MEDFHFDDLIITSEIDLVLPKSSDERVNVSWHSSNENIISNYGKVYLPTKADEQVVLTANFSIEYDVIKNNEVEKNILSDKKEWIFSVLPKEKVVTFWHTYTTAYQSIISEIIESFQNKYPEIKVTQRYFAGYEDLRNSVISNIDSNNIPTIVLSTPDHVTSYLNYDNLVVDLRIYVNDDSYAFDASQFIDAYYNEGYMYGTDGGLYSLPFNKTTELLIYNQDIFNKYDWFVNLLGYDSNTVYLSYDPKNVSKRVFKEDFIWNPTWEEIEKISEAFLTTEEYQNKCSSRKKPYAWISDSSSKLFTTLTQQFASLDVNGLYGAKGENAYTSFNESGIGEFTFLNDANEYSKKALNYLKEQYDLGHFAVPGKFEDVYYSSDLLKNGYAIMIACSSSGVKNAYGKVNVGFATYPQFASMKKEQYQVSQSGTNITLLNQKDEELQEYGWLFMNYLTNYENSLLLAKKTNYLPIRKDVYKSLEYQAYLNDADTPLYKRAASEIGYTQSEWYYVNISFNGSEIANKYINGEIGNFLFSSGDIDTNINRFFLEAKKYLKEYLIE